MWVASAELAAVLIAVKLSPAIRANSNPVFESNTWIVAEVEGRELLRFLGFTLTTFADTVPRPDR
jgi:hypothetical protein